MARKPFDPSLARGGLFDAVGDAARRTAPSGDAGGPPAAPAAPAAPAERAPISVTAASAIICRAVESTGTHRIVGEVSNFSARKHWYFTLKDEASQLDCVMWASSNARSAVTPADGLEVVVTGLPTHWGPRGRTQLVVSRIERRGAGTLQQRFEELCRELREAGYFDESRKRALPAFPRAVAVITSAAGAALQDVLRTARIRAPFVRILVVDVPVQGDAAAPAVAQAIGAVDRRADELGIDAIVVTRGGGSLEDLWAFNERAVADAVFRCRTPVVAAIGHESDTSVVELVADRRASTPTAAVMLLLPDRSGMRQQVDHLAGRLGFLAAQGLSARRRELAALARHPSLRNPAAMVAPHRMRLERAVDRLRVAARQRVSADRQRLGEAIARFEALRPSVRHAAARERLRALEHRLHGAARRAQAERRGALAAADRQLRLLGPEETLGRGWSLTFGPDGALLRRVSDAPEGADIRTRLADGELRSRSLGPGSQ